MGKRRSRVRSREIHDGVPVLQRFVRVHVLSETVLARLVSFRVHDVYNTRSVCLICFIRPPIRVRVP